MDLPEIRTAVGRFLSDHDLVAAALVCKSWNASFTPALYSTIQWGFACKRPTTRAVVAYAHHIRHLYLLLGQFNIFSNNCTKLESVEFHTSLWSPDTWGLFIKLLQRNPRIKSIKINHSGPTMPIKVMKTISSCSGLRSLFINAHGMDPTYIELILDIAVRLEHLTLRGFGCVFPESLDKWSCFPHLKKLDIQMGTSEPLPLLELIRKCPGLKALKWMISRGELQPFSEFCDILKTHCPLIENLNLMGGSLTDMNIAQILDSGHRFVSLMLEGSGFGEMAFQSLTRHFAWLQELNLLRSMGLTSAMAQRIMTSCPKLVLFWGTTLKASDILGIVQGDEAGEGSMACEQPQDWVCTHLEYLRISIYGLDGKPLDWHRKIMQQLARLVKLKTLTLGTNGGYHTFPQGERGGLDLRLESGLDVLSSLKQLGVLGFDGSRQQIGEQDLRWMMEAWPRLHHISGKLHDDRKQRSKLKHILEKRDIYVEYSERNDDYAECDSRSMDDDYSDGEVSVEDLTANGENEENEENEENDEGDSDDSSDNSDDSDGSDGSDSSNASEDEQQEV
ncbi:hypothetical protein BGX34_009178 [Mortierella sp. NVP85]|nr:hypothetical protein BGX34_009178 [Mortierella sp. NVP85]